MKVLVFASLYPNNISPHLGIFVKERMTHFAELNGHRVKVIAPVPYFPPIKITHRWRLSQVVRQEIMEGIEVYHPRYLMTPKVGMLFYGLLMFLSVLPIVKRIQKDFDFDLIDSHFVYPDGFAAIQLGRFFRKPVVVSARGSDINLYRQFALIRRLLRYTLRQADRVIAVSQALKEAMIELQVPGDKITVIPNGVDVSKFYPVPKEDARKKLGLLAKRIVLSVGNVTHNKGFDLLIMAIKILVEESYMKELHLMIVGEGTFRSELEKMISSLKLSEYVHLVGEVPHHELYLWYSAADLFCLASSREGWPNVILESLACGTPVVSTSVGGIPEILTSESVGLLTESCEQAIARGIVQALRKDWQTEMIVDHAKQHSWDRAARSVANVFESALDK